MTQPPAPAASENPPLPPPSSSAAERIACCAASHRLSWQVGPIPSGDYRREGEPVRKALLGDTDPDALDEKERERYAWALERRAQLCSGWFDRDREAPQVTLQTRVFYRDAAGQPIWSAKADLVLRQGNRLLAIDYRFSRHRAGPPRDSVALRTLLAAWRQNVPGGVLESARAAIIQPFYSPSEQDDFSPEDLDAAEGELLRLSRRALDPRGKPTVGAACLFCAGKAVCPAFQADLARDAQALESGALDDASLAAALWRLAAYERLFRELRSIGKERLKVDPHALPGWALRSGDRARVTDAIAAGQRLEPLVGREAFNAACEVSLNQLERAVAERRRCGLPKARALLEAALKGLVQPVQRQERLEWAGDAEPENPSSA